MPSSSKVMVSRNEGNRVLLKHSVTSLQESKNNTQRETAFLAGYEFCCLSRNIFWRNEYCLASWN